MFARPGGHLVGHGRKEELARRRASARRFDGSARMIRARTVVLAALLALAAAVGPPSEDGEPSFGFWDDDEEWDEADGVFANHDSERCVNGVQIEDDVELSDQEEVRPSRDKSAVHSTVGH